MKIHSGAKDRFTHGLPACDEITSPAALRAGTSHGLAWALTAAGYHAAAGRPVLVEAVLDATDVPPLRQELARA